MKTSRVTSKKSAAKKGASRKSPAKKLSTKESPTKESPTKEESTTGAIVAVSASDDGERRSQRGVPHSDEKKALVMGALAAGRSVAQVSKEFNIADSTVRKWLDILEKELAKVGEKKRRRIEHYIYVNICGGLKTLREQQKLFADREYLIAEGTTCDRVAVAYGVLSKRTYRLLEGAGFLFAPGRINARDESVEAT